MNVNYFGDVTSDNDDELMNQIDHFNTMVKANHFHGHNGINHMLKRCNYNVDNVDKDGHTALHIAANNSKLETVLFLLDTMTNLNALNIDEETPLMIAAQRGDLKIFRSINEKLETKTYHPIGLRSPHHVKEGGETLLMMASRDYQRMFGEDNYVPCINIVNFLLQNDFDPRIQDEDGKTALHYALLCRKTDREIFETVLMLIQCVPKNSLIHLKDNNGDTALHLASEADRSDSVIPLLLANGAMVSDTNLKGETPLHIAFRHNISNNIRLLDVKANICTQDKMGRTPIHSMVAADKYRSIKRPGSWHFWQVVEEFMDELDPEHTLSYLEIKDHDGNTPLLLACKLEDGMLVSRLLQVKGINVNAADNNGTTVLHECIRFEWEDIISYLLDHDVDVYAYDHDQITPIILAKENGIHQFNNILRWISGKIEHDKLLMLGFAMGQHKRLGNVSNTHNLTPETLRLIVKQLGIHGPSWDTTPVD
jgi:ankyrin repeat protein